MEALTLKKKSPLDNDNYERIRLQHTDHVKKLKHSHPYTYDG